MYYLNMVVYACFPYPGDDFPSVTTMMEAIFKEEAEESMRQSQNPSQSQNATESQTGSEDSAQKQNQHVDPTVSLPVVTKGSTDLEYERSEADKVADAAKCDITTDTTVHMQGMSCNKTLTYIV